MEPEMRKRLARDIAGLPEPRPKTDKGFDVAGSEVAGFVDEHGRTPEAAVDEPGEAELGAWLEKQRTAERDGHLSAERAAALDELLGPDWPAEG